MLPRKEVMERARLAFPVSRWRPHGPTAKLMALLSSVEDAAGVFALLSHDTMTLLPCSTQEWIRLSQTCKHLRVLIAPKFHWLAQALQRPSPGQQVPLWRELCLVMRMLVDSRTTANAWETSDELRNSFRLPIGAVRCLRHGDMTWFGGARNPDGSIAGFGGIEDRRAASPAAVHATPFGCTVRLPQPPPRPPRAARMSISCPPMDIDCFWGSTPLLASQTSRWVVDNITGSGGDFGVGVLGFEASSGRQMPLLWLFDRDGRMVVGSRAERRWESFEVTEEGRRRGFGEGGSDDSDGDDSDAQAQAQAQA